MASGSPRRRIEWVDPEFPLATLGRLIGAPQKMARKREQKLEHLRFDLRAVIYKEHGSGFWVAHCLEMDVMGHGKTKKAAFAMMQDAVILQVEESFKHQNPSNIFAPADRQLFAMFSAGKDVDTATGSLEIEAIRQRAGGRAKVQDVDLEAREYSGALCCV